MTVGKPRQNRFHLTCPSKPFVDGQYEILEDISEGTALPKWRLLQVALSLLQREYKAGRLNLICEYAEERDPCKDDHRLAA